MKTFVWTMVWIQVMNIGVQLVQLVVGAPARTATGMALDVVGCICVLVWGVALLVERDEETEE